MITKLILSVALVPLFASVATVAQAQDAQFLRRTQTSCRAESVDRFYCPWFSGEFRGPYFDNGCSVKCKSGQKAVCREAHCDDSQNGEPVYSHCSCN